MALHKSSVASKRIEALKLMADNESSVEEKAETTNIVAEANNTNKKKKEETSSPVYSIYFKINNKNC